MDYLLNHIMSKPHLKNHLWDSNSTILLVGYQAEGTLGSLLESGIKSVKIQGETIKVKARIRTLDLYSGHADGDDLVDWVKSRKPIKKCVFLTHGSSDALHKMYESLVGAGFESNDLIIPELDDEFILSVKGKASKDTLISRRLEPLTIDRPDRHNRLAQLTLDIRQNLDEAEDDEQRVQLLKQLNTVITPKKKKEN